MDRATIINNFTYHKPRPEDLVIYNHLRDEAKELAFSINSMCPESREKSLALTKLEEAIMWANASVARYNPEEVTK